jgi:hypothetical protein
MSPGASKKRWVLKFAGPRQYRKTEPPRLVSLRWSRPTGPSRLVLPATGASAPSPQWHDQQSNRRSSGACPGGFKAAEIAAGIPARHEAATAVQFDFGHPARSLIILIILILPGRVPRDPDTSASLLRSEALRASFRTSSRGLACCRERAPSGGSGRRRRG